MSIAIDQPAPRRATTQPSARRTRLVAESVVAGYIHDLSADRAPRRTRGARHAEPSILSSRRASA
jgi:hypothetical protein